MYLYVYIFFLVAVIGLHLQVVMLRAVQMDANQKTIAEIMYILHVDAYAHAAKNISPGPLYTGSHQFCALRKDYITGYANAAPNCFTTPSLPAGAGLSNTMLTNSVAYQRDGINYLVTYAHDGGGALVKTGFTASEIFTQMKNMGLDPESYGHVVMTQCNGLPGPSFMTQKKDGANVVCYPGRSDTGPDTLPNGAVGYISVF